jgi:hypothetical protein
MAKQKIEVWVEAEDLPRIDQARGLASRSAWAREILHGAVSDERPHHGVPAVTVTSGGKVTGSGTIQADVPPHRHRFDTVLDERFVKGVKKQLSSCACGEERWS